MNTIADIAKIAGVAKSTVSRYLNGGSISDKTKKKIEKVMEETGYMPNTFAQSLKAKKTNIIGIIVPRLDSYATARTLIGIDEYLRECNYQMFVSNTSLDLEREIESILTLTKQKVAGIILLATEITERHIEIIKTIQIPVIVVGQEHQQLYSIVHNDYEAAYELGKYVLEQGHRKIAYLGVSEKDIAVGVKRKEGFKKAMQEIKGCEVKYFETSFKIAEALIKVPSIIKEYQPSMIVCATDNIAIGALKAAYMNGLTIPKDLSITGFGGYEVTEMMNPGLTTAKFFYQDAGRMAANSIVKLVNGEKISKKTLSKFEIIIRESVDKLNVNQL
ncbi:LacI family transcriptional regulator [Anaerobacillus alkalidiazotrophicus]|uniref:LacI family transcriptional regulator n=1 Tax=Anaerobacillus alkalidiazotrophicus TaxID=472963 RepID=A0A1S2M052_9BACI|nr:LacI family DNA-binding transcriptional regulator [Anaerobacillus alkalidiazotrophicus]OIJ18069.1 LacI family transcriptional regulator [Anaerobacillus alkalidiazotrophicus]OIJ19548.1 LacI family transcriptional regulator [Anaerobacillus alkalidiazotrophicus]